MSTIDLWDNSWHVKEPSDSARDRYGRTPCPLDAVQNDKSNLRLFSSSTISEMMKADEADVIVWPQSFNDGYETIKDQYIFQISEKDGENIDSITTGNIVGFIGKDKTDIRIHSRFSAIDKKNEKKWKVKNDYFLIYMLEKVMAINLFDDIKTKSSSEKDRVFDLLLFFFPKLLKDALSQGLYKKYVYREYNDSNIHGVVDVNRHIRYNIPANGRIAYRTREYSCDNPVTQLIRHTIEFIRRKLNAKQILHNDPDTESFVQQIVQATPTFQAQKRQVIINMNLRPVVHPYYTKYAALQNLCLRILRYDKLSYEAANGKKIHGLLIDAAWLWEEYIAKVLSEGTNLKHYTRNNSNFHLFEDGKPFQRIIPDYYDKDNGVVADAKYMPLHLYDHLDSERATSIYYKTIMYMYRFDTKTGFLFYPYRKNEGGKKHEAYSEYRIEGRKGCYLYEVGLEIDDNARNYEEFRQNMSGKDGKEDSFINQVNKYIEKS